MTSGLRAYQAWNIAATRFSAAPDALSSEQASSLADEVERALTLESRILESREAMAVAVPYERIADAVDGWRGENPGCDLSDAVMIEALRRELTVQAVLDTVAARVPPADEAAVRAFFAEHPERFHRPERRAVRHILITVNADFADNSEDAARTRVDALAAELRAGAVFAELAARHSECPTAMQGGQVGTVATGVLYPEIETLAFSLPAGAWGGPVRTELGWHLVACDAVLPGGDTPFADAEGAIRAHLAKRARRDAQVAWLRALMNRPVVVAA
jgi:nitrogen fixation protein NifM